MKIEIAIKKKHSQNPITSYHSFKQKIGDSINSEINLIGCVIKHSTLRLKQQTGRQMQHRNSSSKLHHPS
jgi:hypothetical protein